MHQFSALVTFYLKFRFGESSKKASAWIFFLSNCTKPPVKKAFQRDEHWNELRFWFSIFTSNLAAEYKPWFRAVMSKLCSVGWHNQREEAWQHGLVPRSSVANPDPDLVGSVLFGLPGFGSGSGKIPDLDPDPLSTKRPL